MPTPVITDNIEIATIVGQSKYWNGFPLSGDVLLHSMFTVRRSTSNAIIKEVLLDSPEYISIYSPAGGTASMSIKVYDHLGAVTTIAKTAPLVEGCNYIGVSPIQLGVSAVANAKFYNIEVLGSVLRYVIAAGEPKDQIYILYETGAGGVETLRVSGNKTRKIKAEGSVLQKVRWAGDNQRNGLIVESTKSVTPQIRCNSGYYSPEYIEHLAQLICGKVWLINRTRKTFERYYIDESSLDLDTSNDDLHTIDFTITQGWTDSIANTFNP